MNKKLFLIIWITFFVAACVKQTNDAARNVELAKQSFAAFNRHDWKSHAAFFSDTCKYAKMQKTSPDITDNITEIFGVGDKVVVQFVSSGTATTEKGEYKWSLPICCVFTFKNGLIACDDTYYDRGK